MITVCVVAGVIGIISYLSRRERAKNEWKKAELKRDLAIVRRRITLLSKEIRFIKNRHGPEKVVEKKSLELRDKLELESGIIDNLRAHH